MNMASSARPQFVFNPANPFESLFGFIRNSAPTTPSPDPEYLQEGIESINECINSIKYIKDYIPRLNLVLIEKNKMDTELLMDFDAKLATFLNKLPKTGDEWINQWLEYIESFSVKNTNTGPCVICTNDDCELIQFKCDCKSSHMCLRCILKTWYNSTDGLMRSSIQCPLCKKTLTFQNIMKSINHTYGCVQMPPHKV